MKGHPKGLIAAALSNMGERFGYYIMNAVLVLFLCSKFGLAEEKATLIYSIFYMGIYILSLVGGIIADRSQNYKGTIQTGLLIMASGYVILAIPILATASNIGWLLPLTCIALFLIAFGNGLFKGNLQAIVGQMYDDFEIEAAKQGDEALRIAKNKRDSGFQIFYMFINVGGLIAPFVAPLLRSWWLGQNGFEYNADLPALCHQFLATGSAMGTEALTKMTELFNNMHVTLPADTVAAQEPTAYRIYVNGAMMNEQPADVTSVTAQDVDFRNEYFVTAVYDGLESAPSNVWSVNIEEADDLVKGPDSYHIYKVDAEKSTYMLYGNDGNFYDRTATFDNNPIAVGIVSVHKGRLGGAAKVVPTVSLESQFACSLVQHLS